MKFGNATYPRKSAKFYLNVVGYEVMPDERDPSMIFEFYLNVVGYEAVNEFGATIRPKGFI